METIKNIEGFELTVKKTEISLKAKVLPESSLKMITLCLLGLVLLIGLILIGALLCVPKEYLLSALKGFVK